MTWFCPFNVLAGGCMIEVVARNIRVVFLISLACALMSLLTVFCLSAMSIVPRPGSENFRTQMILVAGACFVAWLCVALWVRARHRAVPQSPPPRWLLRLLVGVGVLYLLGVFLLVIG